MKDFGTAVILCGGKSTRMGFDKSLVKINNRFLIEIIGEQLEEIFDNIILVSNNLKKTKDLKYKAVIDIIPDLGPIGAIYTSLKNADSRYVFVTACDMPIINLDYIKYMINIIKLKGVEGVISRNATFLEPLYAFYSVNMIETFEGEIKQNNLRLFDVINKSKIHYVEEDEVREYSSNMDIFLNLNYKADLIEFEKNLWRINELSGKIQANKYH